MTPQEDGTPSRRPSVAEYQDAGLYHEMAPDAADRLALLHYLSAQGASIEEMQIADRERRLAWLGVDRMLSSDRTLSLSEAAQRTGLSEDLAHRVQRAMGLPVYDGPVYSEDNLAMFAAASQLFGVDPTLQFTRVIGASLSRVADAAMSVFLTEIRDQLLQQRAPDIDRARQGEEATRLLLRLPEVLQTLWPYYIADVVRRYRVVSLPSTGAIRSAVGFVDLVDSTRLVQQLSGRELARAVGEFESAATEIALSNDGRVVKFIGDAAMYTAADPVAACVIGLELCDAVADHGVLTAARGAIGYGEVVPQDGDLYGPVVTLASRLVAVAEPGQLLGTPELAAAVETDPARFRFEAAGSHRLRGFDEPCNAVDVTRAR